MTVIAPGASAPEFSLGRADGERFTREGLAGHRSVLVFYPFAFSPVCTDQLQLYDPLVAELAEQGGRLYGISCDATYSQTAFRERLGVSSEQLSDFEPKGAASAAFGVLHPGGFCERALVVLDEEAVVRWSHQAENPGVLPSLELLREGLAQAFR